MFNYQHGNAGLRWNLQVFIDCFIYSSIYLSFAAGAMVYISSLFHKVAFNPTIFFIGVFVTFAVYNLNRKTDEEEDAINHSERFSFTKKHEKLLFYSAITAYAAALVIAAYYGPATLLIAIFPLSSGIFYSLPILPARFGFRRIKEIPLMKSFLVAMAWALPPVLLPVYAAGASIGRITMILILFFFTLVFINTVLFDMRDIEGDAQSGVRTIPVILGFARTRFALTAVNLLTGFVIFILAAAALPQVCLCVLIAGIAYVQLYIALSNTIDLGRIVCDLFIDGQFIGLGAVAYVIACMGLIP